MPYKDKEKQREAQRTCWKKNGKEYNIKASIKKRGNKDFLKYKREYYKKNPLKNKARYNIYNAIVAGKIFKKPCQICGELKVEAHHSDYSKPLDVIWLCKNHHLELHRNILKV